MILALSLLSSLALAHPPKEPFREFFPEKEISASEISWFGKVLQRMHEKPLVEITPKSGSAYRFMIVPTWGNPVAVTLTLSGNTGTLVAKRLDGQGGYEVGNLVEDVSRTLSTEQIVRFSELFAAVGFEKMSTRSAQEEGEDGSEWILERVADGKYHAVVRWSPTVEPAGRGLGAFRALCEWLYRASGISQDATNKGSVEISRTPPAK